MHTERLAERRRAVVERAHARVLRRRASTLREQADLLSFRLVEKFRLVESRPFGERGDTFELRLPRLPAVLGLARQDFARWLERRAINPEDADDILLAFAEACANAVEHPSSVEAPAFEVEAHATPSEVEIAVRDFGSWDGEASENVSGRGRGLEMIGSLMDEVTIDAGDRGTRVTMRRRLRHRPRV